jgi:hypothetical protein
MPRRTLTNTERCIRRNRGYIAAAIASGAGTEALAWALFNAANGLLFPIDPFSRGAAHLLIGISWLVVFVSLLGYRRTVDVYLLEQDLYGCELLVGGALEQRRRIAEAEGRELAEEAALPSRSLFERAAGDLPGPRAPIQQTAVVREVKR